MDGPFRVVQLPDGPNVGVQADPDSPVKYHHKDMLIVVPAPIPEPM